MATPQEKMQTIFEEVQMGKKNHAKLMKHLKKLYDQMTFDDFWDQFCHLLQYNMLVYNRCPAVERTLDFLSKFVTSFVKQTENSQKTEQEEENLAEDDDDEEDMPPLLHKLLSYLLQCHKANNKAIRFRVCQIINKLLKDMGDDAQIDTDIYEKIKECMLDRLRDITPVVRIQAVIALGRLQEPNDEKCPVLEGYHFHIGCDPNSNVRQAVIQTMAITRKTVPDMIERTKDVTDLVRKQAYLTLAEKVSIKSLKIKQRVWLLQSGLKDQSDSVKAAAAKLLQAWLRTYGGNVLELLSALDAENSMDEEGFLETRELVMKTLFKKVPAEELVDKFELLNENLVIDLDKITCESVFYWRSLCQYLKSLGPEEEEHLDKILPTTSVYSDFIQKWMASIEVEEDIKKCCIQELITTQLLELASVLDFSDSAGRKSFQKLLQDMLASDKVGHRLIKPIVVGLISLVASNENVLKIAAEIISELQHPLTVVDESVSAEERRKNDIKIASIRVELNQLREELEDCVKQQEFARAAEIKAKVSELDAAKLELLESNQPKVNEIREERTDSDTIVKCLTIISEILTEIMHNHISPTLKSLMDSLIIPGVANEDPEIRNVAIRSLGLCCLLSKEEAKKHLLLFLQVSHMDHEPVRVMTLKVIFDLLHIYGIETFLNELSNEDEGGSKTPAENQDNDDIPAVESRDDVDETEIADTDKIDAPEVDVENMAEKTSRVANNILSILTGLLDNESSGIRTVCAEGLAKLQLAGRVTSARLFSRLILMWYNPLTEDDRRLRHCLGTFFPLYAFAGRENQQIVEESFMQTLKTLFKAPVNSPLARVNIGSVSDFLVQLTNYRHLLENAQQNILTAQQNTVEENNLHDSIAVNVCNEIISDPNSFNVKVLCEILPALKISIDNGCILKDLKVLSEKMFQGVKEKTCVKHLEKFRLLIINNLRRLNPEVEIQVENIDPGANLSITTNPPESAGGKKGGKKTKSRKLLKSTDVSVLGDSTLNESELLDNNVFLSPMPVKKSKGRRVAKSVAADCVTKLDDLLEDVVGESQSTPASTAKGKQTSTKGRTKALSNKS